MKYFRLAKVEKQEEVRQLTADLTDKQIETICGLLEIKDMGGTATIDKNEDGSVFLDHSSGQSALIELDGQYSLD